MLDYNLRFLCDVVGMQAHKARKRLSCSLPLYMGIVLTGLKQLVVRRIGRITLENIENESFFDGLPHGIAMDRHAISTKDC